eukprot:gnl/TRDRNA2_/TRDRNA2_175906_c0_seq1.p1 gnl/TRDRNA2_/TRDRNA2_175906_c0~~gnl/TRDRNA2_/TRDRNA2_175906_c0_seq1.p1  ORF type:complete len:500 (-),score=49.53 gnl/TRDRNA2_/TRDRNA2_175906_c0_seq1:16-1515(-)
MGYVREYIFAKRCAGISREDILHSFRVSLSLAQFDFATGSDEALVSSVAEYLHRVMWQTEMVQLLRSSFNVAVVFRGSRGAGDAAITNLLEGGTKRSCSPIAQVQQISKQQKMVSSHEDPSDEGIVAAHDLGRRSEDLVGEPRAATSFGNRPKEVSKEDGLVAEKSLLELCRLHGDRGHQRRVTIHRVLPSIRALLGADLLIVVGRSETDFVDCVELQGIRTLTIRDLTFFDHLVREYSVVADLDPPAASSLMEARSAAEIHSALAAKGDVGFRDSRGRTPLHMAAEGGSTEVTAALLRSGARWANVDDLGRTAGEVALSLGHRLVFNILVSFAGDQEMRDHKGANRSRQSDDYLLNHIRYAEGLLLTSDESPVVMDWEAPLMQASAQILEPQGKHVLNIGFGLGLVDSALNSLKPARHTIVEAHPDVLSKMREDGWCDKEGVAVLGCRWEDAELDSFDVIFFDACAENFYDRSVHPTRLIDYSASFSGNFEGHFWRCV